MKNSTSTDPYFNSWVLLHQTRDAILKTREKELSKYNISFMQAAVLFATEALGGKATLTELSEWLFREHHSVSTLINRMEKEDLVKKDRNSGKKNSIFVTLTAKGKQTYKQSIKRESIKEIMSCLPEEELRQLASSLQKLRGKALENITEVRKLPFP